CINCIPDEDIPAICNSDTWVTPDASLVTPSPPSVTPQKSSARPVMQEQALDTQAHVYEGLVICSRAKKLQQHVHAFLSELDFNIDENHILPKSCTLLLLRFTQEASLLGYMEDAEGYKEDTKTAAQAEKAYAHKTQGYMTDASTSCPSLYHLRKRRGPIYAWLEAPSNLVYNAINGVSFGLPS
uniref:Uncharacterized protein n=1 Tax=Setaria italica TaxID=4555 RepID=K3YEJ7_SETIT